MKLMKKEQAALSYFVAELKHTTKGAETAITLGYLVDQWNRTAPHKIDDTNGKRIIRYIRNEGLVKRLMADRYGYFVAKNKKDYDTYLEMLRRRMSQISTTYKALARQ